MTYGFLAGELIRRVSGMDVRTFVARRLAGPLAADIYIGAPREVRDRVARIIGPKARPPLSEGMNALAGRAVTNPSLEPEQPNHEGWMGAQIPAGNGHASAPGLARLYGAVANGGRLGDTSLLSREGVDRMRTALSTRQDLMLGSRTWAAGVVLNSQGGYGPNPSTFGHSGWGGSFGCADPDRAIGIGYVHNQMGPDVTGDVRGISLCNAIYECLDRA
jgi:CubicO group peptidase (beta-lactamase class C family)